MAKGTMHIIIILVALCIAVFWEAYLVPGSGHNIHIKAVGAGIVYILSFSIANGICFFLRKKYFPDLDKKTLIRLPFTLILAMFIYTLLWIGTLVLNGSITSMDDVIYTATAMYAALAVIGVPYYLVIRKKYKAEPEKKTPPL